MREVRIPVLTHNPRLESARRLGDERDQALRNDLYIEEKRKRKEEKEKRKENRGKKNEEKEDHSTYCWTAHGCSRDEAARTVGRGGETSNSLGETRNSLG